MIWVDIAAGGAIGAMARHGLNQLIHQRHLSSTFPTGIFVVNVIGSFAIGLLAGIIVADRMKVSLEMRTFLIVGVLGGFTTFSSFSLDTVTLLNSRQTVSAFGNVVGQVGLSLFATWAGLRLGELAAR